MSEREDVTGVVVVDKPRGPTSHDVVARVRRALGERRVGHAGTLDPMATGVLVVLVGEATKLAPYLTASNKTYRARVALGVATATLDADGEVIERAPLSSELLAALEAPLASANLLAALEAERARTEQIPPAFSAIHVDGRRAHELARAGATIDLAPRPVAVTRLAIVGSSRDEAFLDLEVESSKGYYVRSLARDLGARLGASSHLAALRRLASGAFDLAGSAPLDDPDALRRALVPMEEAARRSLAAATLTEAGTARARQGKALAASDFDAPPPANAVAAWLAPEGELVAIGEARLDDEGRATYRVVRGFTPPRLRAARGLP